MTYQVCEYHDKRNPDKTKYGIVNDGGNLEPPILSMITFQDIWRELTKPQRHALAYIDCQTRPNTLQALQRRELVDETGRRTVLGDAVVWAQPEGA